MKKVKIFWKDGKFWDVYEAKREGSIVTIHFSKDINSSYGGRKYQIPDFLILDEGFDTSRYADFPGFTGIRENKKFVSISKEDFVKHINRLKEHDEKVSKLKAGLEIALEGMFAYTMDSFLLDTTVELLEQAMGDTDKNIEYYIFVLEFGSHQNHIDDRKHIDFSSPEALYDSICIQNAFSIVIEENE